MHIISHKRLKEFWQKHPDAETTLQTWYIRTKLARWRNLAELKRAFRPPIKWQG